MSIFDSRRIATLVCVAFLLIQFWHPGDLLAQSSEDPDDPAAVIDAFIEALGGEMLLGSVETLSAKVTYRGWMEGTAELYFKEGKSLTSSTTGHMAGQKTLYDGKRWFEASSDGTWSMLDHKGKIQTQSINFDLPTDALRILEKAVQFEILPNGKFADHPYAKCVCLQFKDSPNLNILRYFDPETGLLECCERWIPDERDGTRMFIRYSDFQYEEFEGLMFLKSSRRSTGDNSFLDAVYSDFKVDESVDDKLFEVEVDDD